MPPPGFTMDDQSVFKVRQLEYMPNSATVNRQPNIQIPNLPTTPPLPADDQTEKDTKGPGSKFFRKWGSDNSDENEERQKEKALETIRKLTELGL